MRLGRRVLRRRLPTPEAVLKLQETTFKVSLSGGSCRVDVISDPLDASFRRGLRLHRAGLIEIPVNVNDAGEYRLQPDEVAAWEKLPEVAELLPDLWLCGSNSPVSMRTPYAASDVDLVRFAPLQELRADPDQWSAWLFQAKDAIAPRLQHSCNREVNIGLLPLEMSVLPGMADAWPVSQVADAPPAAMALQMVDSRIDAFLRPTERVYRNLKTIAVQLGAPSTFFVGPRWVDITVLLRCRSRFEDVDAAVVPPGSAPATGARPERNL